MQVDQSQMRIDFLCQVKCRVGRAKLSKREIVLDCCAQIIASQTLILSGILPTALIGKMSSGN